MQLSLKRCLCALIVGHTWLLRFGKGKLYLECSNCAAVSAGMVIEDRISQRVR